MKVLKADVSWVRCGSQNGLYLFGRVICKQFSEKEQKSRKILLRTLEKLRKN